MSQLKGEITMTPEQIQNDPQTAIWLTVSKLKFLEQAIGLYSQDSEAPRETLQGCRIVLEEIIAELNAAADAYPS